MDRVARAMGFTLVYGIVPMDWKDDGGYGGGGGNGAGCRRQGVGNSEKVKQ